jgi:putative lipoprotein
MDDKENGAATLAGSRWVARTIEVRASADKVQSTLEFLADGRVAGSTGCNRYSGAVSIDGSAIRFGPLASTKMACPPPMMDQEQRFSQALAQSVRWRLDGGDLLLFDAGGTQRLHFAPLAAAPKP